MIETVRCQKIGRYVFLVGSQGFEGRSATHRLGSMGDVCVRKRRIVGPEAKATALKRRWEVRIRGAAADDVSVFFRFRADGDAQRFANALRRELAELRNKPLLQA